LKLFRILKSIKNHSLNKLNFITRKRFFSKNFEKIESYYLNPNFYKNRKHGLSAIMRIKNDENWIFYAIVSILEHVDEIIVVLQNCTDNTEEIVRGIKSDKIKIYYYPFDSFPSSENHINYLKNSVFNRAYYYNFALSLSSYSYAWKWDGDHAAFEDRVKEIREIVDSNQYDIIHYKGYDIYGEDLKFLCKEEFCANEPSIFKVNKKTFYFSSKIYEEFSYPLNIGLKKLKIYNYEKPLFIHFKYAKGNENVGRGWTKKWKEETHFTELVSQKSKGKPYTDVYPKVVNDYYFKNKIV